MTVSQAAEHLEVESSDLVYRLCQAGRLAHTRIGLGRGTIRIAFADVEALREAGRVEVEQPKPRRRPRATAATPGIPDIIGQYRAQREVLPAPARACFAASRSWSASLLSFE